MLEAHAPYEPIRTWKGFFIHIATIVVGLLIAIGLEQSVEFYHHRNQLQGARLELMRELQENQGALTKNMAAVQKIAAVLEVDLSRLRDDATRPMEQSLSLKRRR